MKDLDAHRGYNGAICYCHDGCHDAARWSDCRYGRPMGDLPMYQWGAKHCKLEGGRVCTLCQLADSQARLARCKKVLQQLVDWHDLLKTHGDLRAILHEANAVLDAEVGK